MPVDLYLLANHQDVTVEARPDPGIRGRQRVHEPTALRPDIECRDGAEAEAVLQQHAVAGREVIRCGRGEDDGIDRLVREPGGRDRDPARPLGQVDAGLTLAHPVPLADAGALRDPLHRWYP